jgi:hypothetical protein
VDAEAADLQEIGYGRRRARIQTAIAHFELDLVITDEFGWHRQQG